MMVGALVVNALVAIGALGSASAALQRPAQVTTTPGAPTTFAPATDAPTIVAPSPVGSATTEPSSTSPGTSTTPTTTAPAPESTTSNSSPAWGWIIAAVALGAIALIAVLVARRRSTKRDDAEWKSVAVPAVGDADLTRDMLSGEAPPGEAEDTARVTAMRATVDRVATTFDRLAAGAPNDDMHRISIAVSTSLRGYFFALEAEQMLHRAPTTPTAEQLASADATKRGRLGDFDVAVNAIRRYVTPAATPNA